MGKKDCDGGNGVIGDGSDASSAGGSGVGRVNRSIILDGCVCVCVCV